MCFHVSTVWAARDREVIYNLSYPIPNLTYSWCSLFIQTRLWGQNHGGINHSTFYRGNAVKTTMGDVGHHLIY
jgi:hypothetical protein